MIEPKSDQLEKNEITGDFSKEAQTTEPNHMIMDKIA